MYISVKRLKEDMGVDPAIARFFVDRKIPAGNIFWKNRLLYVGKGNGYISIPVYYDLLYRIGVPKDFLLEEEHVRLMEQLMHFAILAEYREIAYAEELSSIRELYRKRLKNPPFFTELCAYLEQPVLRPLGRLGRPQPALNRADVFLFILTDLDLPDKILDQAVSAWYALHPTYLIMDDIHDYEKDKEQSEENVILDFGDGEAGFAAAFATLHKNSMFLQSINPVLAAYFERSAEGLKELIPKPQHGTR
jgi:hypothetical protein